MTELPYRGKYCSIRNIKKVFVMGGTHGNERVGVHVVQYIKEHLQEFKRGSVTEVEAFLGNPQAVKRNSRYIHSDLNRDFSYNYRDCLSGQQVKERIAATSNYEEGRALEIRSCLKALERPVDFLIDLHTTTSNMGNCLMVSDDDPWTDLLCEMLMQEVMDCRILYEQVPRENDNTSSTLALNHITLEMGAIQQGVAQYTKFQTALDIIKHIISGIDKLNGKEVASRPAVKKYVKTPYVVDYPRDGEGINIAMVHDDFFGKDFQPLQIGQRIFCHNTGESICFEDNAYFPKGLIEQVRQGDSIVPFFIGEAAYIEKGIAFLTARVKA